MSISPPRPGTPPLNALRAFEAAARLGGFARAAEELGVTPGAVSQHIRTLEDWLGAPLFQRRSQGVVLTDLGAVVAPSLTGAFDAMGAAVQEMRARSGRPMVHIAALPSVAQLWLSPRLPGIRAAHPGIGLSVSAVETPPNLAREPFDLSLFLREVDGVPSGLVLERDRIFPVCAPDMAAGLGQPEDLRGLPLLHDAVWSADWPLWAREVLGHAEGFDAGPRFSLYAIALEEARHGAGVLMGHACLVRGALERGDLVAPFGTEGIRTGRALVLDRAGPRAAPAADLAARALSVG